MPFPVSTLQAPISLDIYPTPAQSAANEATVPHSLEYADQLYLSTYEVMERHYNEEGSYLGLEALDLFCQVLYGHSFQDPRDYHYMDTTFAFVGLKIRPSHFLRYIEYLVTFVVTERKANVPVSQFIDGIKDRTDWTFGQQEDFKRAWSVFWNAIFFNPDLPGSASFESGITELWQLSPPNLARVPATLTFKTSLMDLQSLNIKVRPTLNLDEHMTLEEDTLKILKLTRGSWNLCLTYPENRVAKALKIDTLGSEVLGSLHALYGEGALMKKAGDMELVLVENDLELAMWTRLLMEDYNKVKPVVLATRTLALQKLVKERRAWWPTLKRDVKLQSSTQPILFYGSILAVISVISGIIQAVAGIWSVVLVYKPPK